MRIRVQKWGTDLALRIPKSFAEKVGLQIGSAVEVSLADGKLVIAPIAQPDLMLKQLLAQVTDENLHHEVETGFALGNEVQN